ncbi:MAG TPA: hypothetical protein VEX18_04005, partial [Polyangiaceae bacterium]|nr:hypothetical protein [Polyangiaceae bacterium]
NNDVVTPERGTTSDSYLQYFNSPGQPVVYTQHSTLVPAGQTVLSEDQTQRLGIALDAIHKYFFSAYGSATGWYAIEVDWKFDDKFSPGSPRLFIKQARPYPPPRSETKAGCLAR